MLRSSQTTDAGPPAEDKHGNVLRVRKINNGSVSSHSQGGTEQSQSLPDRQEIS